MGPRIIPVVTLGLLAGCGGGGGDTKATCAIPAQATATSATPKDNLDLSHWALTLPVDSNGANSGIARTVTTAELLSGYESEWFYSSNDNGVTFFAPIQGATTANTVYPRSELREVLDPSNYAVNWSSADVSELLADVIVHQVPSANGKVTLGQIVGYNGTNPDVSVLTKLIYEYNANECTARLYTSTLATPTTSGSQASQKTLRVGIPPGAQVSYSIRVENKTITFTSGTSQVTEPIGTAWDAEGLYFRAGASLFTNGTSLTDGARVTFLQLEALHPGP
ncbi:MAG TPA: polysaccharide lyase family 7 protein [Verrucomicrobiae bacterium]|nr:polysaccharide lyase family 7 protein [Verrucomicrobiae bacterium]